MPSRNLLFASVVGLGLMCSVDAYAQHAPTALSSRQIIRSYDIASDSPEFASARRWLADAVTRADGHAGSVTNVSGDVLGHSLHVEIRHTSVHVEDALAQSPAAPWLQDAAGYRPGDTATARAISDGWSQTWTQTLTATADGMTWKITDYRLARVP